ncbi:MAG: hypothetical protein ACI3W8_06840 [Oscillospiraceae bacterium]
MTLYELSFYYEDSAQRLRLRLRELRQAEKLAANEEEKLRLRQRAAALAPLLREMRELTALSRHYYDRSYHKNEKYTL